MRSLTKNEERRKSEIHPFLRLLFDKSREKCIKEHGFDIFLVCGHRDKEEQDLAFANKLSKVQFPNSKHNRGRDQKFKSDRTYKSDAMDTCPFPINWNDIERFKKMNQVMMDVAKELGMKIRFGADFNMDGNLKNDKFVDLPHCEIIL